MLVKWVVILNALLKQDSKNFGEFSGRYLACISLNPLSRTALKNEVRKPGERPTGALPRFSNMNLIVLAYLLTVAVDEFLCRNWDRGSNI